MREYLLDKLSETTDEERRILAGLPIDEELYFSDRKLIKSEKMLGGERGEIGIKSHPRYAAFPEHRHNFVEMMIVLRGKITHRIGDEAVTVKAGDVLLMDKHVRHSIDCAKEEDLGVNVIMADRFVSSLAAELGESVFSRFLKDNAAPNGQGTFLHFRPKNDGQAENLIENIIFGLTEPKTSAAILSKTIALLFYYLAEKSELLLAASKPSGVDERRREKISAYIKSHYRDGRLGELGGELFLSVPYLSKLIVTYFGKSFKELLLEERMRQADILITKTDMPILEVIRSVGYENDSYFHKEYKKKTGTSPLSRRNQYRKSKL